MKIGHLHPRNQLVSIMNRIYAGEMTTLSGGNLSILDQDNQLWITPGAIDKGNLLPSDIICIKPDGSVEGPHAPSSEYPFHRAIYDQRPDIRAVVHAHPPGLVAFSITGEEPDARIIAQTYRVCGPVGYAPYSLTGSEQLGKNIASTFSQGLNNVMLENHGIVCGGIDLLEAFQRMEALDFCARTLINAMSLGEYRVLQDDQLSKFINRQERLPEFLSKQKASLEIQVRQKMIEIIHRAYDRQLMLSSAGVVSARLDADSFLITPEDIDRRGLETPDIVLIKNGKREQAKVPSHYTGLHQEIYRLHPEISSVISTHCPYISAFIITPTPFETRTIPESYMLLRDVPRVAFDRLYASPKSVALSLSKSSPVLLIENDSVLTTGSNLLQAFDRLEVLEYSARALLKLTNLGSLKPIDQQRIREIEEKILGE